MRGSFPDWTRLNILRLELNKFKDRGLVKTSREHGREVAQREDAHDQHWAIISTSTLAPRGSPATAMQERAGMGALKCLA